jgi:hypothetical protein
LLKAPPERSRDLVQQKSKGWRIRFHCRAPINELAYDKLAIVSFKR